MKKSVKRILVAAGLVLGLCALLVAAHMLVNRVDFAGLLKSMHGAIRN